MADFDYVAGLDLGQTSDYSALAVMRREAVLDEAGAPLKNHRGRLVYDFACVHLERYPLGTSYGAIVSSVKALMGRPELRPGDDERRPGPRLAVDGTGVGRAVIDMFIDANMNCKLVPITITGGNSEPRQDPWSAAGPSAYWTPKIHLVGAVQAVLSSGRLKIAPKLPLAELLRKELTDFKVKFTASANETFNARDGAHDDLVLAAALAIWLG